MNAEIPPTSRRLPILAGLLAAGAALASAELIATFSGDWRSPVVDVGNRIIDLVPPAAKDLAIAWFGTADKLALLVGIGLILAGYASVVGVIAYRRSLRLGVAGVALFGVVGAISAAIGVGGPGAAVPSLIGAGAGSAVLAWLIRGIQPAPSDPSERRRFLARAGGVALGAVGLGFGGRLISTRPLGGTLPVAPADLALPPLPSGAELGIDGLTPFVTPNSDFYRIDTALVVPRLDPATYSLRVHGMVEREISLSYEELIGRPLVEADITLTCVSNEVGGKLAGNARWLGVRVDELLAEAGISGTADQIVGRSADGYTCGFPVSALDGRDALVAVAMNGEPLPPEHGYPARLIVPGLYGYVSATKWLTEIELTTFEAFDHYWVPRGYAAQAPIKTFSRIDTPGPLGQLTAGPTVIAGVAWAQTRGIDQVEVRIDEGDWETADLAAEVNDSTWRQWKLAWNATPGRYSITCRATDATGELQAEARVRPAPDGATGWHSVVVLVEA